MTGGCYGGSNGKFAWGEGKIPKDGIRADAPQIDWNGDGTYSAIVAPPREHQLPAPKGLRLRS